MFYTMISYHNIMSWYHLAVSEIRHFSCYMFMHGLNIFPIYFPYTLNIIFFTNNLAFVIGFDDGGIQHFDFSAFFQDDRRPNTTSNGIWIGSLMRSRDRSEDHQKSSFFQKLFLGHRTFGNPCGGLGAASPQLIPLFKDIFP